MWNYNWPINREFRIRHPIKCDRGRVNKSEFNDTRISHFFSFQTLFFIHVVVPRESWASCVPIFVYYASSLIIEHLTHIFSHLVVFIHLYHINLNIFTSHLFSQIQIVHENQARMLMGPPQNSGCFSFFRRDRRESKDWQPTTPEINTAPYTRSCKWWKCTKGEGSWRLYFSSGEISRFQLIISATSSFTSKLPFYKTCTGRPRPSLGKFICSQMFKVQSKGTRWRYWTGIME